MHYGVPKDAGPRRILLAVRMDASSAHVHTQFAFTRILSVACSALYYRLAASVGTPRSLRVLFSIQATLCDHPHADPIALFEREDSRSSECESGIG
jgi:hypothetical protein